MGKVIDLSKPQEFVISKRGQLAQIELTNVAQAIYSPPEEIRTEIDYRQIAISNRTNQDRWVTIWYDDDGAATTNAELIIFELDVPSKDRILIDAKIFMDNPDGTISMQGEGNNQLIVTMFGTEYFKI